MGRDGLVWYSSAANPPAAKATAGVRMTGASGLTMAVAPISPSKAAEATAIMTVIMTVTATVMGIAATTMDMARAKSSRAHRTICTNTIAPPTLAAACSL